MECDGWEKMGSSLALSDRATEKGSYWLDSLQNPRCPGRLLDLSKWPIASRARYLSRRGQRLEHRMACCYGYSGDCYSWDYQNFAVTPSLEDAIFMAQLAEYINIYRGNKRTEMLDRN